MLSPEKGCTRSIKVGRLIALMLKDTSLGYTDGQVGKASGNVIDNTNRLTNQFDTLHTACQRIEHGVRLQSSQMLTGAGVDSSSKGHVVTVRFTLHIEEVRVRIVTLITIGRRVAVYHP